ncbi:hypothetical protein MNBD_GAMMA06-488 [hydrothermal vent metagenome]|uniref:Uncharacterized protein n=1 Tax=hydrothermal vent metagenome TaxID=652676 RepID=A0A3B0XDC7_9ZZZZ
MRYFFPLIFFVTFFSSGIYAEETVSEVVPKGIKIIIVDIDNKAFNAEIVRWWYLGEQGTQQVLKCFNKQCDKRFLKEHLTGSIVTRPVVISADMSIVTPEDASCWRLYHGETLLKKPVEQAEIVMQYKNKACK